MVLALAIEIGSNEVGSKGRARVRVACVALARLGRDDFEPNFVRNRT
jgi:hypothetical protein